ncbi:MAG: hypothetical protein R3B13_05250 [Polyangiaceae bacterium]
MARLLLLPLLFGCALGCTSVLGVAGEYDDQADGGGVGGSAGAGGGGIGGTGGVSTGNEICDNGKDDDGDQLVDCADPDCTGGGYACVEPVPAGFVGPIAWRANVNCGAPFDSEFAKGGIEVSVSGTSTCPTCTCDAATGTHCGWDALLYNNTGCTGGVKPYVFEGYGTCLNVGEQLFGPKSVKLNGLPRVVGGSCAPSSSGQKAFPSPSFPDDVRVCRAAAGAGCSGSEICAPPNTEGAYCISRDGDVACPGGYSKRILYRSWQDGRDCVPCTCGAPTGTVCNSASAPSLFTSQTSCGSGEIVLSSSCSAIPIDPTYGTFATRMTLHSSSGATCAPSGGTVSGAVTPTDPVTVCCKPI